MKKHFKFSMLFIIISITIFLTACLSSKPSEKEYTITYHTNTIPSIITTTYKENIMLTEDMMVSVTHVEDNYTKEYWYLDENFNERVIFPYTVTKNEDFYLKWIKNEIPTITTFKVNFYVDKQVYETKNINKDEMVKAPTTPQKENAFFKGWYENETGTGLPYDFTAPVTKDIDLYAIFTTTPVYEVSFVIEDLNIPSQYIEENNTLENKVPSKTGYTFEGWYENKDFEGNPFDLNTKITKPYTLYGKMTKNKYKVYFYNDKTLLDTKEVLYKDTADLPATPSKNGYTFKGWSLDSTKYQEFTSETLIEKETSVYAYFEINIYEVTFYNGTTVIETQKVNYNSKVTKPAAPTVDGYDFDDWYTDTTYQTKFDFDSNIINNTKVYANYIKQTTYTVTFEVDGVIYDTQTIIKNGKAAKPEDPTKDGHSFTGWYLNGTLYSFNSLITTDITLVAQFEEAVLNITSFGGYNEGAFIVFDKLQNVPLGDYTLYYKKASASSYSEVDQQLIREQDSSIRCDVIGLDKGDYILKIEVNHDTPLSMTKNVTVYEDDRSGYAHFNASNGIGAYNDNGTLKSDAIVVYVTNETKNTVTVTANGKTYTGLVNILQNQKTINKPISIRIIGKITTNQYKKKSNAPRLIDDSNLSADFFENELETTYGENLVGLTVQYMDKKEKKSYKYLTTKTSLELKSTGSSSYKDTTYSRDEYPSVKGKKVYDDDSYFNMLDIEEASFVTLEGIGTNAEFFQWGLTWKKCKYIEVKNITFTDYTEDACSFEAGSNSDVNTYGHYWVHNNTFNRGKNNWDISGERDKYAGDGGIDLKCINSVTLAYNTFNNCKKTGLVGGSDSVYTKNITFHHNYYYKVESRLPLGRQANMHIYNNFYDNCGTCQDIRANAFVLSEANYFLSCTSPQKVTVNSTYKNTIIKSYNDYLEKCSNDSAATVVSNRTEQLSGNCKPDGSTNYTNFDTNSTLFYYDSVNNKSNVSILLDYTDVPEYCKTYSGVLKETFKPKDEQSTDPVNPDTPTTTYTITYNTNGGSTIASSTVNENSILKLPANPTKENHTFDGWYIDEELKTKFDTTAKITKDMTLYAKWKEKVAGSLTFDISQLADTTLETDTQAGDFILSNGIIVATSGSDKIIKTGGNSSFKDNKRLIKFETTSCTITVTFASQNSAAIDRYIILYDSTGKEIARSSTTLTGSAQSSFTFTITESGSYSFGTYGGIIIYDIVIE